MENVVENPKPLGKNWNNRLNKLHVRKFATFYENVIQKQPLTCVLENNDFGIFRKISRKFLIWYWF